MSTRKADKDWRDNINLTILALTLVVSAGTTIMVHRDGEEALKKAQASADAARLLAHSDSMSQLRLAASASKDALDQAHRQESNQHADTVEALKRASEANQLSREGLLASNRSNVMARQIDLNGTIFSSIYKKLISINSKMMNYNPATLGEIKIPPNIPLVRIIDNMVRKFNDDSDEYGDEVKISEGIGASIPSALVNPQSLNDEYSEIANQLHDSERYGELFENLCNARHNYNLDCKAMVQDTREIQNSIDEQIEEHLATVGDCVKSEIDAGHVLGDPSISICLKKNLKHFKTIDDSANIQKLQVDASQN